MNFAQTVLLGAIAGLTIYLGLPLGRLERVSDRLRSFLTMTSAGILIFLLFDIFHHIEEPIEDALKNMVAGKASMGEPLSLLGVLVVGLIAGSLGLVLFESRFMRASKGSAQPLTPGR